jgi:hypothetical protein
VMSSWGELLDKNMLSRDALAERGEPLSNALR